MPTISPDLPNDGDDATVEAYNPVLIQILTLLNGQLDSDNIDSINADALPLSSIDASMIDWDEITGGIWWQELGRHILSAPADLLNVNLAAPRKHLRIIALIAATGGTVGGILQFNNDTAANYAFREKTNDAAESTTINGSNSVISTQASVNTSYGVIDTINYATREKQHSGLASNTGGAGASALPNRRIITGKWANSTDQITSVQVRNNGTGDYAAGSLLIVLGHD